MIWTKVLPNGETLNIDHPLLQHGEYRPEREYIVSVSTPGGGKVAVCRVGAKGEPKVWYTPATPDIEEALKELPDVLSVEQVMNV